MALQVTSTPTAEDVDCEISSDDDSKTNSKLKRPPGLARITSKDDSCIEQDPIKRKSKKKTYPQTPNPISNTKKKKKKSKKSSTAGNQKIAELQAQIKSLTRDNRVLQRKLEKSESKTGKKQKKMDSEREMRLAANKERFALKQKLEKLQKAIAVRLKLLGVDFSKIDNITTALDTAFNVIQKLAKQLQQKEEEFNGIKMKMSFYNKMKKEFNTMTEKNKALAENKANLQSEIQKLREKNANLSSDLEGMKKGNSELVEQNKELLEGKYKLEMNVNDLMCSKEILELELEAVGQEYELFKNGTFAVNKNKCKEFDELKEEYERYKEFRSVKESEYTKSIFALQNKLKEVEIRSESVKAKEVKYESTITALHEEIRRKDELIKSQKKEIKMMQNKLDMVGYGDNKKFSQMSLLKTNVQKMHSIIRDKDNQIKTLNNKLKSIQKEK